MQLWISNHSPIMVSLMEGHRTNGGMFRFLNHLSDHPLFLSEVATSWRSRVNRVPMLRLVLKLKAIKNAMKSLNGTNGYLFERVI